MGKKLLKPGQFNQPAKMKLTLPYPPARIKATITIMCLDDGTVRVMGAIGEETIGRSLMIAGMEELEKYWASGRSMIVGPAGQPLARRDS